MHPRGGNRPKQASVYPKKDLMTPLKAPQSLEMAAVSFFD
jgi:hypothetical protein